MREIDQFLYIPATFIGYDELKGMAGGPMEPESIWVKIPDWFYDDKPISQGDVEQRKELRTYQGIQRYFGKNLSLRGLNEFLFGDEIKAVELLVLQSMESSETRARGVLMLDATVKLPSGNNGTIRHAFYKDEQRTTFDYLKPDRNDEKFSGGFGREFFKRYLPALRELGIKQINIKATSVPSAGMNGAYTWYFYGFTNRYMKNTLQKNIRYLEDYYGVTFDRKEINAIMEIRRMRKLLTRDNAEEFLSAERQGYMTWEGIIPDIFDEDSVEMYELKHYLSGER